MKTKRKNPVDKKILVRVLRAENRRLREDLNEQTAYADEYHASLTEVYSKLEKERALIREKIRVVKVGAMVLAILKDGTVWLTMEGAEGMAVNKNQLEAVLRDFMQKHF
jgi:hypothetical protein